MSVCCIKDLLELNIEVDEVLFNTFEDGQLSVHNVELLVALLPLEIIKPLSRVRLLIDLARWAGKEESPLTHINLVVAEQDLCTKEEREE